MFGLRAEAVKLSIVRLVCNCGDPLRKLTPRFKRWLAYRRLNEFRRRHRKERGTLVRIFGPDGVVSAYTLRAVEKLPRDFCLETNRDEVIAFLESVRSRFVRRVKQRYLPRKPGRVRAVRNYFDFVNIENITPAAALVLAAEYDRGRIRGYNAALKTAAQNYVQHHLELDPDKMRYPLIDVDKWQPQVLRTLYQLGFFRLLDIEDFVPDPPDQAEYILPFQSGDYVDSTALGEFTIELRSLLDQLKFPNTNKVTHVHGRLVDAVENVIVHAYPTEVTDWQYPHVGRWWITASVDSDQNRINLIVYDQGVSIPGSLPYSPKFSVISGLLTSLVGIDDAFTDPKYDADAIKSAIEAGRSQTEDPHRGKGLLFMRDLVKEVGSKSELRIMSRNGAYLYRSDGHEEAWNHDSSIGGTLIEWRLYL